jgi:osmoprotectant transport system substrate-binding protein
MRPRFLVPTLIAALLAVAACSSGEPDRTSAGPRVAIVGQNSTETDVLSELYRALLDQAGFSATVKPLGARDIYLEPLEKGKVQVAADTLSATTEALNHAATGDAVVPVSSPDAALTLAELTRLGGEVGLTPLAATRAELKTGYAVTKAFAQQHGLRTLSDLGGLRRPIALAASPDCAERPDCAAGLENVYGIALSKVEPLGAGTPDTKAALARGQVQLAQVATTDAQVGRDLVLLQDDRHLQNAENLVPLVNTRWLKRHDQARSALDRLTGVLTTEDLRRLTAEVNEGHETARKVARDYLARTGLT